MSPQDTCAVAPVPVLDSAAIHAQLGPPGSSLVDELLDIWLGDLDHRLRAITIAAGAGDVRALIIAAHTLRGSSMYVAATRLADSCAQIERLINDRAAWPVIDAAIGAVWRHAAEARAALIDYRRL